MTPAMRTLLVTAMIMPLVYYVTWKVLNGNFSTEVQAMVAGAVMGSGLGSVVAFWLGSSASSQRKTELVGGGSP